MPLILYLVSWFGCAFQLRLTVQRNVYLINNMQKRYPSYVNYLFQMIYMGSKIKIKTDTRDFFGSYI